MISLLCLQVFSIKTAPPTPPASVRQAFLTICGWCCLIPGEGNDNPTPALLPEESHGWRSLLGYSPWGLKELDTTEWLHFHTLEKEMATHSSVLAWRIPGMGEPPGLPSMGSHRVGHDWTDLAAIAVWSQEMDTQVKIFLKPCHEASGLLVPGPGFEPTPMQWEPGVLTAGPLGSPPDKLC